MEDLKTQIAELNSKINMLYNGLPVIKHAFHSPDSLKQFDEMMKTINSLENIKSQLINTLNLKSC